MQDYSNQENLLAKLYKFFKGKVSKLSSPRESFKQTVNSFIEEHQSEELLAENSEINIIQNVLTYGELRAGDIMVPRTDIEAIEVNISHKQLISFIEQKRHTRFPVYENSLDNILGFINIKDLLPKILNGKSYDIRSSIREILIIPTSLKIIQLLSMMKKKKTHIALVVDELGGTDGLITAEDVIEEIIGDMQDEHDAQALPDYNIINDHTMVAKGRLDVKEFERAFNVNLSSENGLSPDYDTIGGLILTITSHVPERGTKIKHPCGIEFEILDSDPRKINQVIIRK